MVKKRYLGIDVVTAAKNRIKQEFAKRKPIQLSISGGKDSIVLSHIILDLIRKGEIDKSLLTVTFIDEEAMYDDVIEIVKKWRVLFIEEGVKFEWFCIPVKHFNCLNTMEDEETFICWDPRKKNVWVRERPSFAITDDPYLIPYKDNYQSFCDRKNKMLHRTPMIGIRVSESVQRRKNIAIKKEDNFKCFPIYDMTNDDVWLYIKINDLEYPKTYENLYRVGTPKGNLRISQFFSIDTARSLVSMGEIYPDLMERIVKREPNAYLCALYWDTEMFGKNTNKRKKLEDENPEKDYKKAVIEMLRNGTSGHPKVERKVKPIIINGMHLIDKSGWKEIYSALIAGDPKERKIRSVYQRVWSKNKNERK